MVQTVPVNKTALSSCLKAALFLRCVGIRNIQQGGYWMFKGACRLDDLAHRHIIFIFPVLVKLYLFGVAGDRGDIGFASSPASRYNQSLAASQPNQPYEGAK
jgi:hypothetical protein